MAFRRADYVARGPLDEHFAFYRNLDIWWSLVLRDQDEDAAEDAPPAARRPRRRASPSRATRTAAGPACRTTSGTGSRGRTSTGC